MNQPSKVKVIVSINAKGKGSIAEFIRSYTMEEHCNDKYIDDGEAYALEHFKLKANEIVVQDSPVINKQLKTKIEKRWGSGDKVVHGQMAMPKVHNPMHSCFKSYKSFDIDGSTILVKPVSAGVVYAIENETWINELKIA